MSFQIIGDSCCDYPYLSEDYTWLVRVPLTIELDGIEYVDDKTLACTRLLSKMAVSGNAPKSACPAPGAFFEAYDCGADDIYVVTLSDKLSGSFSSAVIAANMFKEKYPDRNIFVFTSRSAASGEIAICEKLYELASSGMAFDDVVKGGLKFISELSTYFVLENLDVFRKNGRLNHLQSIVTNALKLKLVMGGDETGNICVRGKALSINKALASMADMIAKRCPAEIASQKTLYITQCSCPERAQFARDLILKKTPFKDCLILRSGGISTIYANEGGLVVCF